MPFIYLRRSRNTRSYLLVESYRDEQGKTRKRILCYLGREADGTDTLEKALTHWQHARDSLKRELRSSKADRKQILRRRLAAAQARIAVISEHAKKRAKLAQTAEAERLRRERQAEEAEHWRAFDRLRRDPTADSARAAKRAFLALAKIYHPDQGGTHDGFLRVKEAYDRARAV